MYKVCLRLDANFLQNKLSQVGGAAAYTVGAAAYTAGAAAYTAVVAAYNACAAAYTAGASAYMRLLRIKLTQSSRAETGTELGKMEIKLYALWRRNVR